MPSATLSPEDLNIAQKFRANTLEELDTISTKIGYSNAQELLDDYKKRHLAKSLRFDHTIFDKSNHGTYDFLGGRRRRQTKRTKRRKSTRKRRH